MPSSRNQNEIKKIYESLNSDIREILEIKEFKKIKEKLKKLKNKEIKRN